MKAFAGVEGGSGEVVSGDSPSREDLLCEGLLQLCLEILFWGLDY